MITLDFETYYDKEYSLSKLTTEQYIRDPRFQIIGVGVKEDDKPSVWRSLATEAEYTEYLAPYVTGQFLLAHHAAFDGAILNWRLGLKPKFWLDTLSMGRPRHNMGIGVSLKALADYYEIGAKGTEVVLAMGKRREDFSAADLHQYGEYCKNDVDLTYVLFGKLKPDIPKEELKTIDLLIRMYTEPMLELDKFVLTTHLDNVQAAKAKLVDLVSQYCSLDDMRSNNKFADILRKLNVEPPTKISLRTGKSTWAFSKTDVEFKNLLEHDDVRVQTVVGARLGTKSTIEETRTESFIKIADRGTLPIMLHYYGAHTGRGSGGDKINLQNLPRGGALRRSIRAPDGHMLVACDSAQIEARVTAWLAGQDDLVGDFRDGVDIYSKFASTVYDKPINKKEHPVERFLGKTCLAENTIVVTNRGMVKLSEVNTTDLLWDGEQWVPHSGVKFMGIKPTLTSYGLTSTADHEILTERGWVEWQEARSNQSLFQSALSSASLPSSITSGTSARQGSLGGTYPYAGAAAELRTSLPLQTYARGGLHGATSAQRLQLQPSGTGPINTLWQTTSTALGCLTDSLPRLPDATLKTAGYTSITGEGALLFTSTGGRIAQPFYSTSKLFLGGMTQSSTWTASTITAAMYRAISGLLLSRLTLAINEKWKTWSNAYASLKPVYDIVNAGPRHRFTVMTERGPIIVHNCILGLGFGTGAVKLRHTLKVAKEKVELEEPEANRIVDLYRKTYPAITRLWYSCNRALAFISRGNEFKFGHNDLLKTCPEGIMLPNDMLVRYPHLFLKDSSYWYCKDRKEAANYTKWKFSDQWNPRDFTYIYGPKVTENVVQALARIIVFKQMNDIQRRYRVVLTVHDEVVCCVPEDQAEDCKAYMLQCMSTPLDWCQDLPISAEADIGKTYGDAK